MTRDIYTPPDNSVAKTVVDYFRKHPKAEVAADDMFELFDIPRSTNIRMILLDAYTTNLLARKEVGGDLVYSAGHRLLITQPKGRAKSSTQANVVLAAQNGPPDPMSVPIDDDVPVGTYRGLRPVCWPPLLARLVKVGQSFELPLRYKSTLSKSITQAHKDNPAKFSCKIDKKADTVRVWRVA